MGYKSVNAREKENFYHLLFFIFSVCWQAESVDKVPVEELEREVVFSPSDEFVQIPEVEELSVLLLLESWSMIQKVEICLLLDAPTLFKNF